MSVPAGWYPDPAPGSSLQRFWDGATWTDRTRAVEAAAEEPFAASRSEDADSTADPDSADADGGAAAGAGAAAGGEGAASGEEDAVRRRRRRRTRRAARPSYGTPAAPFGAALIWVSVLVLLLTATDVSGWSPDSLFPPDAWFPVP